MRHFLVFVGKQIFGSFARNQSNKKYSSWFCFVSQEKHHQTDIFFWGPFNFGPTCYKNQTLSSIIVIYNSLYYYGKWQPAKRRKEKPLNQLCTEMNVTKCFPGKKDTEYISMPLPLPLPLPANEEGQGPHAIIPFTFHSHEPNLLVYKIPSIILFFFYFAQISKSN